MIHRRKSASCATPRATRCAGVLGASVPLILLMVGPASAQDAGVPSPAVEQATEADVAGEPVIELDASAEVVATEEPVESPPTEATSAVAERETLRFDDGVGFDDVPWEPRDDVHMMHPIGSNFGLQLRVAGAFGQYNVPVFELGGIFDHRFVDQGPWHFRVVVAFNYQVHFVDNVGGGTTYATNPLGLRLRMFPIAVDIGEYVSFHLSGDVGMALTPRYGSNWTATFLWGALAELNLRLVGGRLEIGLNGGLQMSTLATTTRSGNYDAFFHQGVVGGRVGWLFE